VIEEAVRLVVGAEQRLDPGAQIGIAFAGTVKEPGAVGRVADLGGGQEHGLNPLDAGRHGASPGRTSPSHATFPAGAVEKKITDFPSSRPGARRGRRSTSVGRRTR